jgi:Tol biopolymer transport system component
LARVGAPRRACSGLLECGCDDFGPPPCSALAALVAGGLGLGQGSSGQAVGGTSGSIFAPIGRQAGWLDLEAPRPRSITTLTDPAYVVDTAIAARGGPAVVAVSSPYRGHGAAGADIERVALATGAMTPLVGRASVQESLVAPAWTPDGSGLLIERDDLARQLPSYAGEATPRFASRVDLVAADGSGRTTVVDGGRMPTPAPDGSSVAFVRTTAAGTGLVVRSDSDGSTTVLVPFGRFPDIAYPRFAPAGDRVAFIAPETFVGGGQACSAPALAACVVLAHGLPWDLWMVNRDGSGMALLAAVAGDDASDTWSPDGSQLLVYGGTGGFLVDAMSGSWQQLPYLAGYGSTAWLPN